jgi:hypothetical protein
MCVTRKNRFGMHSMPYIGMHSGTFAVDTTGVGRYKHTLLLSRLNSLA